MYVVQWEGNVLTRVCPSVCPQGGGGQSSWGGVSLAGGVGESSWGVGVSPVGGLWSVSWAGGGQPR